MRRDARRIPAFFDSRLNCAAGASLGFAVIETILEWDRFLANGHGNLRLLVSVAWYAYAFVALCIWASREGTQELGAWTLLILFAMTVPALLESGLTLIEAILRVAQFFLVVAALFLIFTATLALGLTAAPLSREARDYDRRWDRTRLSSKRAIGAGWSASPTSSTCAFRKPYPG